MGIELRDEIINTVSQEIMDQLLDCNQKIEQEKDVEEEIAEIKEVHAGILELNRRLRITRNTTLDLFNISEIEKHNSIARSLLVQYRIDFYKEYRHYEQLESFFTNKLTPCIKGGNAETRKSIVSGLVAIIADRVVKLKTLLDITDMVIVDIAAIHSSLKIQFFALKTDLSLSVEVEDELGS